MVNQIYKKISNFNDHYRNSYYENNFKKIIPKCSHPAVEWE